MYCVYMSATKGTENPMTSKASTTKRHDPTRTARAKANTIARKAQRQVKRNALRYGGAR